MALSRDQFIALVTRLEAESSHDPRPYRLRLGLLAALGFAYLFALLGVLILLLVILIGAMISSHHFNYFGVKGIIFLLVFAWFIVRALWVVIPRPEGILLARAEYPMLFALIDQVCGQVQAPKFHKVLLTDDYNAAVTQIPRLGLFGWDQNYLILGLPFMESMTPAQFRAVLAHEIGHISARHGRFGLWIWRVRETWSRLMEQLAAADHKGAFLVNWFANWYGPYFMAYSFVLARADEREADRFAAELVGQRIFAEQFVNSTVRGTLLSEELWPAVYQQVVTQPMPPAETLNGVLQQLRADIPVEKADRWLLQALHLPTDYDDTHPSLQDRLAALGYPNLLRSSADRHALLSPAITETAAQAYLGGRLDDVIGVLDLVWRTVVTEGWTARHQEMQQALQRLQQLAAKTAPLSEDEAWEQAKLTAECHGREQAEPLLEALLARWPQHAPASFALGQYRLQADDERGIALIKSAMSRDVDFQMPGCQALYTYYRTHGRHQEADTYLRQGIQRYEVIEAGNAEASTVSTTDQFVPHGLSPEVLAGIVAVLQADPEVGKAYLVRKQLRSQAERTCYVLGLVPHFKGLVLDSDEAATKLLERLNSKLPLTEEYLLCTLAGNLSSIERPMKQVTESLIYTQTK